MQSTTCVYVQAQRQGGRGAGPDRRPAAPASLVSKLQGLQDKLQAVCARLVVTELVPQATTAGVGWSDAGDGVRERGGLGARVDSSEPQLAKLWPCHKALNAIMAQKYGRAVFAGGRPAAPGCPPQCQGVVALRRQILQFQLLRHLQHFLWLCTAGDGTDP